MGSHVTPTSFTLFFCILKFALAQTDSDEKKFFYYVKMLFPFLYCGIFDTQIVDCCIEKYTSNRVIADHTLFNG